MIIRKLSIGPDYKSGAMHYLVGQEVLNANFEIHLIKFNPSDSTYYIYIHNKEDEILLWKSFSATMPIAIEYNISF